MIPTVDHQSSGYGAHSMAGCPGFEAWLCHLMLRDLEQVTSLSLFPQLRKGLVIAPPALKVSGGRVRISDMLCGEPARSKGVFRVLAVTVSTFKSLDGGCVACPKPRSRSLAKPGAEWMFLDASQGLFLSQVTQVATLDPIGTRGFRTVSCVSRPRGP